MMADRHVCLNFHGIGTPARSLEAGEAPYWITPEFFKEIIDEILALPNPSRVCITFDDSNISDHDIALPVLQARGMTASFFVLSGRIGQTGSLGEEQIRALQGAGMEIGSHGVDHLNWARLEKDALGRELTISRQVLERICGQRIRAAGIPFGGYNAKVLRAITAAGYECAYSSDGGTMNPDAFLRPRSSVREDMDLVAIRNILADRMSSRRRLRRRLGMMRKRLS